jgi:hypothetical protein
LDEVPRIALGEVCKYEPDEEGVDMLRKSPQKVVANTMGDRDYGIFEAVHVGAGPLHAPVAHTSGVAEERSNPWLHVNVATEPWL